MKNGCLYVIWVYLDTPWEGASFAGGDGASLAAGSRRMALRVFLGCLYKHGYNIQENTRNNGGDGPGHATVIALSDSIILFLEWSFFTNAASFYRRYLMDLFYAIYAILVPM